REMAREGGPVTLSRYLEETGLDLDELYSGNKSWSDLRAAAGLPNEASGPYEEALRRACGRLLHIDDMTRIETYRRLLRIDKAPHPASLSERDRRLVRMLVASLIDKSIDKQASLEEGCAVLWSHPQIRREICELLEVLGSRIDHVHHSVA